MLVRDRIVMPDDGKLVGATADGRHIQAGAIDATSAVLAR